MKTAAYALLIAGALGLLLTSAARLSAIDAPLFVADEPAAGQALYEELREQSGQPGTSIALTPARSLELHLFVRALLASEKRSRVGAALIAVCCIVLSASAIRRPVRSGRASQEVSEDQVSPRSS